MNTTQCRDTGNFLLFYQVLILRGSPGTEEEREQGWLVERVVEGSWGRVRLNDGKDLRRARRRRIERIVL